MIVTISQEKAVEVLKESFKYRFDVINKENPGDWLRLKELFINDIKNDKELTEKSKNELIEFINNLETEEIIATDNEQ